MGGIIGDWRYYFLYNKNRLMIIKFAIDRSLHIRFFFASLASIFHAQASAIDLNFRRFNKKTIQAT